MCVSNIFGWSITIRHNLLPLRSLFTCMVVVGTFFFLRRFFFFFDDMFELKKRKKREFKLSANSKKKRKKYESFSLFLDSVSVDSLNGWCQSTISARSELVLVKGDPKGKGPIGTRLAFLPFASLDPAKTLWVKEFWTRALNNVPLRVRADHKDETRRPKKKFQKRCLSISSTRRSRACVRCVRACKSAFYLCDKGSVFLYRGILWISPFKRDYHKKSKNFKQLRREKRSNSITHATLFISFHSFHTHTHTHTHHARVELNSRTPRARLRSERSLVSEREREIFLLEFFQCQTTTISLLLQSFSLR